MLWRVMSYYSILLIGLCVIVFTPLKRKIQSARIKKRERAAFEELPPTDENIGCELPKAEQAESSDV